MIVITTPTGDIGRQVLDNVLASGAPARVIVRDPSRLPPRALQRVEVVAGSHGDAAVVDKAFAGADAVFWVAPPNFQTPSLAAAYLDFARPACAAIGSLGVKRVVGITALGRGSGLEGHAGLVTASLAMDDLIARTGAGYRGLLCPSFMDNMLRQVASIKTQGVFYSPISGDLKIPTAATRDIAAVAANLLLDPSWSGHEGVPVLGPEDLSNNDMARIISEVLGKPVRFQHVAIDAFRAQLLQRGASEAMAQGMADMMAAKDKGLDKAEPRTAAATTPTTFRQWCEEVLKPAVLA